ncbi:hypothetical protein KB236_02940 [Levilactobacillus brevis]|nr:hypothetical protein KB236_02940 [Levilactobacillus brevis]
MIYTIKNLVKIHCEFSHFISLNRTENAVAPRFYDRRATPFDKFFGFFTVRCQKLISGKIFAKKSVLQIFLKNRHLHSGTDINRPDEGPERLSIDQSTKGKVISLLLCFAFGKLF